MCILQKSLGILPLILLCILVNVRKIDTIFLKITNVFCESLNKSWVVVNECRLKAKSRNVTLLNINTDFLVPVNDIILKVELKKKANGYKPFLFNITIDGCQFMRRRNNPAIKYLHSIVKNFSTITHKCPYVGEQYLKNFYLRGDMFDKLPLPTGDYLILLTWIFDKKPTYVTNVYFMFVEDLLKM